MSRDDSEEVPPPRSPLSTTALRKPRSAASRAIPAPVIPPPMTSTSTGSDAIEASAAARVRWEKGVSLVGVLQLGPAAGSGEVSRLHRPDRGDVQREENVMPVANGRRVAGDARWRTPF